jgi:hypothetical protein
VRRHVLPRSRPVPTSSICLVHSAPLRDGLCTPCAQHGAYGQEHDIVALVGELDPKTVVLAEQRGRERTVVRAGYRTLSGCDHESGAIFLTGARPQWQAHHRLRLERNSWIALPNMVVR